MTSNAVKILALLIPTMTPPAICAAIRFLIYNLASTVKLIPNIVTTHADMQIAVLMPAFEYKN